ncbi:MAG: DUF1844 domain-containing protein [Bacteroidota bacterium]|nr:DUF1844 domain-containing protein [Bacteroidota bacterium]
MSQPEKNEILLTHVILMFQTAALQQMGKLKNPITDKVEKNLEMAQTSIDILDMLFQKMKNNLSENENRMFVEVLKELKLNYVDEVAKEPKVN